MSSSAKRKIAGVRQIATNAKLPHKIGKNALTGAEQVNMSSIIFAAVH
jgi:hypothetical protein